MKFLVNAEEMKEIEAITITQAGVSSMELMERAAMEVASFIREKIEKKDRILAVCGVGNNGGDGVATACILMQEGYQVDILLVGEEVKASLQMKQQLIKARNLEVNIFNNIKISEYTVIIDAIFGIGLNCNITGIQQLVIQEINNENNVVFSIDLPSGISADDGQILNVAVKSDYTITFGLLKRGLILYPGCEYAGKVIVSDIGFSKAVIKKVLPKTFIYEKDDLNLLPKRANYSNKGTYGKVLIIAGSRNMSGACYFAAKAAYRSGAGIVKILTVQDNRNIIQTSLPEAILSTYEPMKLKDKLEVDHIINELAWATSVVIGPGIGISASSGHLLDIILKHSKVPTIMDADAINLLSTKTSYEGLQGLPENIMLTPHLKEMSRICHCDLKDISKDIVEFALKVVKGKSFILTIKDARTVVTDGERAYVNVSGNNGMATGGSGDVLTGIIAALLAQGMSQFEANSLGVWIHGLAGDYAAIEKSRYSLIASDIIDALPKVFLDYEGEKWYEEIL